ncbi:MAG TPA: GAF domain-containing sensor histidine kinase [Candidatus Limnocylindrales bacterium]|nr:GAF domain-containing sensor histidine kinase [Candidatus Limnocylindrales bacterium]
MRSRFRPVELLVGIGGSLAVLVVLLARPPWWEAAAIVLATLLPAGLVLYGATAHRRAATAESAEAELRRQRESLSREAEELGRSRTELQTRLSELTALNEIAAAVSSTLDLDELVDGALEAIVSNLPFDRALVLLVDDDAGVLTDGRSIGAEPAAAALLVGFEVSLSEERSTLVQLAHADGPLVFRDVHEDTYEPNREFARALEVTSFLGTPLVTKGRTVGVLAVDNRLSGREVERSMGPLLFTVGNLLAAAVENARGYAQVEAQVARRTAQLATATEEAQHARATAEAASATKSEFLANVSHELRTPLTSIVGFTKIVRKRLDDVVLPALVDARATAAAPADPKLDRAVRQLGENLEIVVAEGDRLTALVTEILDLEKIEAGRMEFRNERVDVADVVDRATAATAALFETTGLELRRDVEADLPPVDGDPHRLVQVVINLLSNAVKFTPAGSVTVRATTADDGTGVVVSVADTGTGIAPEDRERVFEQFAQAGDTLTDTPRGTGLGLAICRQIVEHHRGRIWLESEVGEGSTFSFSLPAASSAAPAVASSGG